MEHLPEILIMPVKVEHPGVALLVEYFQEIALVIGYGHLFGSLNMVGFGSNSPSLVPVVIVIVVQDHDVINVGAINTYTMEIVILPAI